VTVGSAEALEHRDTWMSLEAKPSIAARSFDHAREARGGEGRTPLTVRGGGGMPRRIITSSASSLPSMLRIIGAG
jgi:hypothetical protein